MSIDEGIEAARYERLELDTDLEVYQAFALTYRKPGLLDSFSYHTEEAYKTVYRRFPCGFRNLHIESVACYRNGVIYFKLKPTPNNGLPSICQSNDLRTRSAPTGSERLCSGLRMTLVTNFMLIGATLPVTAKVEQVCTQLSMVHVLSILSRPKTIIRKSGLQRALSMRVRPWFQIIPAPKPG
ncbi:hypothetical protein BKA82DRAFT_4126006 [Pisolithus tinctorius]|nr:hypothetical protein BKA82DRAFT_4126006 [Pisolithus tinctorius]